MHLVTDIVAFGHVQKLVANLVYFRRDCKRVVAQEVTEIRKTVLVDSCKVIYDKAIIHGRLHKEILFKEFPKPGSTIGTVGAITDEIGFDTLVEVPGARPGDRCVVVHAFVAGQEEEPTHLDPCGGFSGLHDKSVVSLCVAVIRESICNGRSGRDDSHDWSSSGDPHSGEHSDCTDDCVDWDTSSGHDKKQSDHESGWDRNGSDGWSDGDRVHPCSCEEDRTGDRDASHSPWESKGHKRRHLRPGRKRTGCPKPRSTGLAIGGQGRVPQAHPGPVAGTFIGPTLLFVGIGGRFLR